MDDLKDEKIGWTFFEKDLPKKNQTEFRIEKVRKNNSYVKSQGYDNSITSWIEKIYIFILNELLHITTIIVMIFWDFFMFYQIFHLP